MTISNKIGFRQFDKYKIDLIILNFNLICSTEARNMSSSVKLSFIMTE